MRNFMEGFILSSIVVIIGRASFLFFFGHDFIPYLNTYLLIHLAVVRMLP